MKGLFLIFLGCLAACHSSNHSDDALLQQPPFKNITDSIHQQPQNAALYYKRGSLLLQNDQLKEAATDFRRAWNLQPAEQYALPLANLLARKHPDSAIQFIQQALQKVPQSLSLRISLARGFQQKKEWDKALAVCNEMLAQYPGQLDALQLKAEILQSQSKTAEAIKVLETAYSFAPFDVEVAYNLAFEYAQAKNAKALAIADSLIKMDTSGTHAEPYYFKGVYYANTGNMGQALSFFNQAIQHDYYFLDAYMEKGRLLYQQKKYPPALQTFQLAATVSPTFADAYFWQGKVQQAMGNNEEAKLNYQRAFGLDKSMTEANEAARNL